MSWSVSPAKSIYSKSRRSGWQRRRRHAAWAQASWGTRGFTLTEVMLAVMLLSVGLLGTVGMLTSTTRGQSVNANRSIAATLAKEQLEQIEDTDYVTVIAANYPAEPYASIAGFEQFQRTVTIALDTPVADMKRVTVTVTWRDPSNTVRNATVSSVITP